MFRIVLTEFDGEVHVSGFEVGISVRGQGMNRMMHWSCNNHRTITSVIVSGDVGSPDIIRKSSDRLQISVKNCKPALPLWWPRVMTH